MNEVLIFGLFLREMRRKNKKTQAQISHEVGVTQGCLFMWESGRAFPKENRLGEIAVVYGIKKEELKKRFDLSKKSREEEKKYHIGRKAKKGKSPDEIFSGKIAPLKELWRYNDMGGLSGRGRII